jgi:hypothetical protein
MHGMLQRFPNLCVRWLNFFATLWAFGFQQEIKKKGVPLEVAGGKAAGFGGES